MILLWNWYVANSELLARTITILGFPIAILSYIFQSRRQQRDRETGTYSSLDDKYADYLQLCIDHPSLGMFHTGKGKKGDYDDKETVQRYAMFETVVSIFERAFLMMHEDHRSKARSRQWNGWETYLKSWIRHPDFKELWTSLGGEFDSAFVAHVDELLAKEAAGG